MRMTRRYIFSLAVSCILLLTFSLVSAQSSAPAGMSTSSDIQSSGNRYLVQLNDMPAARYDGGVRSFAGTSRSATGTDKFQSRTDAAQAYVGYLAEQQASVAQSAEALLSRELHIPFNYYYAVNGFATFLTSSEAARLERLPGVAVVAALPDQELHTDRGPQWIGATDVYNGEGPGGHTATGEGMVVGIIDSGLNMLNETHPSFADVDSDGYDHTNPLGEGNYLGWCDSDDENYDANLQCNDKVIGAYDFLGTSPDDINGHGSHVASTAAGNHVSGATINAPTISVTKDVSGVAPHANLIIYGVEGDDGGCCDGGALVAAIDQITADAYIVDVLNYSIGGGDYSPWTEGQTPLAFLGAFDAGITVVTSAGNAGPDAQTLGSPGQSPWMLAVGATTHDRVLTNELVDITDGEDTLADIGGAGFTSGHGPAKLIYAGDVASDETSTPELCGVGSIGDFNSPWPAGTFDGEIVVCRRGTFGRVEKGANALAAGAGGYILVDNGAGVVSDPHVLPGLHVTQAVGDILIEFIQANAADNPMGTITGSTYIIDEAFGDIMGGFSSRGPQTQGSVIKPDVAAPGVAIWAAYADDEDQSNGPEYTFLGGTSMASPHTAGSAALIQSINPTWTPAEVYSALMMTGKLDILKEDGTTAADPFDIGGGRIQVDRAVNAYLVLDESTDNFLAADPAIGGDPSSLNLASMGQDACLGSCSWTRTVRATKDITTTWDLSVTGMAGFDVTVTPESFTLGEIGATATFTVEATVNGAPDNEYVFGTLMMAPTPRDGSLAHGLHMSIAAQSATGSLPDIVTIQNDEATGTYTVEGLRTVGVTDATYPVQGLDKGSATEMSLAVDPTNTDPYDNVNDGTVEFITVEVTDTALRLVADITESTAPDLDLYVGTGGTPSEDTMVCTSATAIATEYCNITGEELTAGTWWILVQNWAGSGAATDDLTLMTAVVEPGDDGNLTVSGPTTIIPNQEFSVDLTYNVPAAQPGDRYYGAVYILPTSRDHIGEFDVDLQIYAAETLALSGDPVGFELGIPPSWSVTDDAGTGLVWTVTEEDSCEFDTNYATESSKAACVNSDTFGTAAYDTSLISNEISFGDTESCDTVTLDFVVNYFDLNAPDKGGDQLDVDVSTDGGITWTTVLKIEDTVGAIFDLPGVAQSVDLVDYLAEESIHVRFRFYNPDDGENAWDWYAQVDDVALVCQTSAGMNLSSTSITHDIEINGTVSSTLTIESTGTGTLEYDVYEDGRSANQGTAFTLTQSTSQAIDDGAGVSCGNAAGTVDNEFLRVFDLSESTFDEDAVLIKMVEFGVDDLVLGVTSLNLTANVYTLDGALSYENMTLVGSGELEVTENINDEIVSIPVETSFIPTNATIVVGVAYPDSGAGSYFYPGTNDAGQTGPNYLAAAACGFNDPVDYADIGSGFPDHHLVMNVLGETEVPPTCFAPSDITWMSIGSASGTLATGESADVAISFDGSGLSTGIYTGTLCVSNNVDNGTIVQVPVELHVYTDILDPTDVALGQVIGNTQSTQLVAVATGILLATFSGFVLVRRRRS